MTASPALEKAMERNAGTSKLVYNKETRTIDTVRPSLPSGADGSFEHINRIEAMRNRLAAGETTFTLEELKLTLAWADHLNYFLSREKQENATLLAALTASEAERERLRKALADYEKAYEQHQANVRRLDVALNGADAAPAPLLIDVLGQVEDLARKHGPLLAAPLERLHSAGGIDG